MPYGLCPQGALLLPVFALSIIVISIKTHGIRAALRTQAMWIKLVSACFLPAIALIAWIIRVSDVTGIPFSPYVAQRDVRPSGLIWPWQRILDRFLWMLNPTEPLSLGRWLEGWHLALLLFTLIALCLIYWRGRLRFEVWLFTLLSIFLPLMTAIFGIGRFATLTWLPLVFVHIIPAHRRLLDRVLWSFGIILSLLVFIALDIYSGQVAYVP